MIKVFLKDSLVYVFPTIISRGLSFILVPLYTRVLSPADYGSLDLLIVFASIINLTIALEVSQGVARFYTDENDPEDKILYASSAFWLTFASYTIFAVFMYSNANSFSDFILGQPGLESSFRIGIFYIWINGLFYLIQSQFRWEFRSKDYAAVSILMTIVTSVFSILLAYGLKWGLNGLLIGMLVGSLTGTLLGLVKLRNSFQFRFDFNKLREMLAFSTPLVVSGLAVWMSMYIDRMMINYFLSLGDVGLYGIGFRLASVSGFFIYGFNNALTPLIYKHYRDSNTPHQIARVFRIFIIIALGIFLVLSLFATDIIRILTTEPFYEGAEVVVYLLPAVLLSSMYMFTPGIALARKTNYLVWINLIGALINIILNLLFIPKMGFVGAGIATMTSYFLIFFIKMIVSQKLYHVPHLWMQLSSFSIFIYILGWLVPQLPFEDSYRFTVNILCLVAYVFSVKLFGLVNKHEINSLKSMIQDLF